MNPVSDNMQKYANYKEQMGRLKKAMTYQFYLEAIAIEYAIIEDRIESVLRHSGVFNPAKHNTLTRKLSRISELRRNKKGVMGKYISEDLLASIYEWKDERNPMTHALLKLELHTEDLQSIAEKGNGIVKSLTSKVTSYNRALERQNDISDNKAD